MQFYAIEVRFIPVSHTHIHILNAPFAGPYFAQQTRSQQQGTRVGQGGGNQGARKGYLFMSEPIFPSIVFVFILALTDTSLG